MTVHTCELDLGREAWRRLDQGRVSGSIAWDGGPELPVTVSIRGAHSRRFPKRSLQVTLTGRPLPDEPPAGHTVKRIHLNADYIDPTRMRSALSFALFEAMAVPAPRCRHVALSISGQPEGIYIALESVDADFICRRGWADGPIYYAVNRNANFGLVSPLTHRLKSPLESGYHALDRASLAPVRSLITELNMASERSFGRVARRWIDVDAYLDWLSVAVFVGNRDGFVHNYALHFDPARRRFRLIPWDYDATFGIDINGNPARLDRVPVTGWNKLSYRLLAVPQLRSAYRERFLAALDGPLGPDVIDTHIDKMRADLDSGIDKGSTDQEGFDDAVEGLRDWASARRELLRIQLREL